MAEEAQSEMELAVVRLLQVDPVHVASVSEVLSGRSFAELQGLPAALAEQKKRLAQDTEALVYENYTTFLRLAVNVSKTRRSVNETKVLQGSLQDDVRQLEAACAQFADRSVAIAEKRAANRAMMQHYPQILELLEIPQLIEAFVRSRSYDKALDLLQYSRRSLAQQQGVPVLEGVARDVRKAADAMRDQILAQLASDCDMETAIRSVDHLRRLDVDGDELELRAKFLQMRNQWMENGKTALPVAAQVSRWLAAYAERLRTDLFYVVTQYNTLFAGEVAGGASLLWSFAFRKVREFVEVLEQNVPRLGDGEEIGAVAEQCMYCGSSLSRVGMDFRILTHPIFENSIRGMFRRRLDSALFFFTESLRTHDWRIDSSAEQQQQQQQAAASEESSSTEGAARPPSALMKHPPLGMFTNELLDALNQLRYCVILSLADELRTMLRATLAGADAAVQRCAPLHSGKQAAVVSDMHKELIDSLIPHIENCRRILCMPPQKNAT